MFANCNVDNSNDMRFLLLLILSITVMIRMTNYHSFWRPSMKTAGAKCVSRLSARGARSYNTKSKTIHNNASNT